MKILIRRKILRNAGDNYSPSKKCTESERNNSTKKGYQYFTILTKDSCLKIRQYFINKIQKKKDFSSKTVKHSIAISIESASFLVLSFQFAKPSLDAHVKNERTRSDTRSLPYLRETQLYSRSSQAHLRILGRKVDALGKDGDIYGKKISIFVLFLNLN